MDLLFLRFVWIVELANTEHELTVGSDGLIWLFLIVCWRIYKNSMWNDL